MNIHASSYRLCSEPTRLRALFDGTTKVAVISNALDFSDQLERRANRVCEELQELSKLGLRPQELDLRRFFGFPADLRTVLEKMDGIWVLGGNAFILRRAMQYSGLDVLIKEWALTDEEFVYAGYSAGSCVLGPTLRGIHLVDPPDQLANGYQPEVIWDGLGVLPYSIAPHFDSDHPESSQINDVVDYFEEHDMPYRTLRDGEAIVVQG